MRELLVGLGLASVALDPGGRVSFANDALLELLGRGRAEVEGTSWFELAVPHARREQARRLFARLVEGSATPARREDPVLTASGEERLVKWEDTLVFDPAGRVQEIVSIGCDVTAERQAQAQMALADAAVDAAVTAIAFADTAGRLTRVNGAFLDAWGLRSEADAVGRHASELWASPDEATRLCATLLSDGRCDDELIAKTAAGPRVMRLRGSLLRGIEGHPIGVICTFNDISALRQAEARLLEAQRIAHVGDWEWRLVDDTLWWSDEVYRIFGVDRAGFTPSFESFMGRVLEEDRAAVHEAVETALRLGSSYSVDHRIRRPDGVVRWVQENGEPLYGADGERLGLVGTVQDVTARRATEEGLRQTSDLLRTVVASSPVVVFALDRDGILTLMEGRPMSRIGLVPGQAVGRPVDAIFTDGSELGDAVRRALAGETVRVTGRLGAREVEATCAPQLDARGDIVGVVGVAFDVTERRRLEAQLAQSRKIEAVGMLAGGVAHDFNNLLAVILSAGHLIEAADQLHGEAADDLRQIMEAAGRAAALTQQLLALGRRQVLELTLLDANQVLRSLKQMLRRVIGADVAVRMRCEEDIPEVLADRSQLDQVLMNLIVNARDAMPTGGTLTLSTGQRRVAEGSHPTLSAGEYVTVEVEDTGVGMDAKVREQVFQPFFSTKETGWGTGLGLATCYGIVRQSGGAIELRTELGRGSAFTVLLPAVAPHERTGSDPSQPSDPGVAVSGQRILLVEDDPQLRLVTTRCLEQAGFSVRTACDGLEALEALRERAGQIDLVVTDVVMPGLSGADFARRARAELGLHLPFLFLSGYTDDTALRYGIETHGVPFLRKPFTPASLVAKVRQLLAAGAQT